MDTLEHNVASSLTWQGVVQSPYLQVSKRHRNANIKGSYGFKEQYALLEVGYHRDVAEKILYSDQPLARVSPRF